MSRHGYTDDDASDASEQWAQIRWQGMVASALRGKRGRQGLRDLIAALDALPEKRLVHGALRTPDGAVCAVGALAAARGVEIEPSLPPGDEGAEEEEDDWAWLGEKLDLAACMVQEIEYVNDEFWAPDIRPGEPPLRVERARWLAVRRWAVARLEAAEEWHARADARRAKNAERRAKNAERRAKRANP